MNKSTTENLSPELQPNNELKADEQHVSPAIGNTDVVRSPKSVSHEKYEIVCPRCLSLIEHVDVMSHLWSDEKHNTSWNELSIKRSNDFLEVKKKIFLLLKEHETKFGNAVSHRIFVQQTWLYGDTLMQNHLITTSTLAESEARRLLNETHPPLRKNSLPS